MFSLKVRIFTLTIFAVVAGILLIPRLNAYKGKTDYRGLKEYKLPVPVIGAVPNFALIDQDGEGHELYRYNDYKGIVLVSQENGCDKVRKLSPRLRELNMEYGSRGIKFLMLNTSATDTRTAVTKTALSYLVTLPILMDDSQVVARELGFTSAPEAVLIDTRTWKQVYKGGGGLRAAIEDLLHGRQVGASETSVQECPISFSDGPPPLFTRDVAPIIWKKCEICHSEKAETGAKPDFDSYEKVKSWLAMIKDSVLTRRMPTWGADSRPGEFLYDYSLSASETRTLISWINAGAPRGPGPDLLARKSERVSQPVKPADFSVSAADKDVPPMGFNEYQYAQLGGSVPADMWVEGFRVHSTNPAAIHHQMLIVASHPLGYFNDRAKKRMDPELQNADTSGTMPVWVLGEMISAEWQSDLFERFQIKNLGTRPGHNFPMKNGAIFIPKGAYLILETHYHGTGRAESERTTFDLYNYRGDGPPNEVRNNRPAETTDIDVAPGDRHSKVVTESAMLMKKSAILSIGLHMHMRGRSVKVFLTYPDGRKEQVLSVPFFNYNTTPAIGFSFPEPKIVPAGTRLNAECVYDNSASNPYNPDPTKTVHWGQTVDRAEMCRSQFWYHEYP
jgi:hypothetical protein